MIYLIGEKANQCGQCISHLSLKISKKLIPKTSDVELEVTDELYSLLTTFKKDFKWLETWPTNFDYFC